MKKPTYIDLFAGCGGLSLGLEAAGFELELAVEKSDMAAETFYHNFIDRIPSKDFWKHYSATSTPVEEQAKSKLIVKELQALLENSDLVESLRKRDIDLIAGGPPCQGFSLAGRRNPDDIRNQLPWQFIELVERVNPKMVLIENVSGIRQNFKKHSKESPFDQLRQALVDTGPGYVVQSLLVNAMHFGAPQHRPRVMLIGLRADIATKLNVSASEEIWRSEYDDPNRIGSMVRPSLAPMATHFGKNILTVKDAIWDLDDRGYDAEPAHKVYRTKAGKYAKRMRQDTRWMSSIIRKKNRTPDLKNHVLRKHADFIKTRFRLYQYIRDNGLSPKLLNLPSKSESPLPLKMEEMKSHFEGSPIPAIAPDGTILAESLNELCALAIALKTKKHSQRPLNWDRPAPTIVSLPEDYVHPSRPRTMTVREMARFQSFPDTFEFRSKETTGSLRRRFEVPQYTQVGNAVPPILAEAVGNLLQDILQNYAKGEIKWEFKEAI